VGPSPKQEAMGSLKQHSAQRRALRWAQRSICAGCGRLIPSARRLKRYHPDYPTFDHLQLRSEGGRRTLANGLLKHQRCNVSRGDRPPNGCDFVWAAVVQARLAQRPTSFKTVFRGGVRSLDPLSNMQSLTRKKGLDVTISCRLLQSLKSVDAKPSAEQSDGPQAY
jgi:hypothetical protein